MKISFTTMKLWHMHREKWCAMTKIADANMELVIFPRFFCIQLYLLKILKTMFVFNFLGYVCSVSCQVTVILILIPIPNPHTINSLTYGKIAKKGPKKDENF